MEKVICPYCGKQAELKDSAIVYNGKSYGPVYVCPGYPACDSYVGVHKGTDKPLGRMADRELRKWKKDAHFWFDNSWRDKRPRDAAYQELAQVIGVPTDQAHIGMFDVDQCKKVVNFYMLKKEKT